jgi:hypothetical protein
MKSLATRRSIKGLLAVLVVSLLPSFAFARGHGGWGGGYHGWGGWHSNFGLGLSFGYGGYYPGYYYGGYNSAYSYDYAPYYPPVAGGYYYAPAVRYYYPPRGGFYYYHPDYVYGGHVTFRYR